ncbi:MAG: hypothetical protein R2771_05690 [Saprospiraceae bacterium]
MESVRVNVDNSYRMGIEIDAGFKITEALSLENATFSKNKIKEFTEYVQIGTMEDISAMN